MFRSTKILSDYHHQEQPSSHRHQPTQWLLKQMSPRLPRPKRPPPQHQQLRRNLPQQEPRQRTYYKVYKERSEEPFQEVEVEEGVEAEQDPQGEDHQPHLPMFPNNQRN